MKVVTKVVLLLSLFGLLPICISAQSVDKVKAEQQFYTAYITNSNPAWKISLGQLENNSDEIAQLLLAKGYYAAAGTALGNQDKDLAGTMLDKGETATKLFLETHKKSPEGNSLLSAIYGMKIGLSPMKGMFLGSKSASFASKGVNLAPENGFTNFVKGNYLFYTPSMFGGDVKDSITYLKKAKTIYEKQQQTKNWEYMSVLTLLGQAYTNQKQYDQAKAIYQTALQLAPNFGYVKNFLLPQTEKAAKS